MTRQTRSWDPLALLAGVLFTAGCLGGGGGSPGAGGSAPSGAGGDNGGAGTDGAGTAGSTGSGASGTTGAGSGGTTSAGTAGTTSGGTAGTTGAAGRGGGAGTAAGTAGRGGAGAAGRGGAAGTAAGTAGRGGTTGSAGTTGGTAGAGDDFVTGVMVAVHPNTTTILVVTWTQARASDNVWLEFSFAGSSVMTSRPVAGATGAHRDVVLGVPGTTAVTIRIVNKMAGTDYKTRDYMGTTGAIPTAMPKPTILSYDAALASPDRYMLGAVENSPGGCANSSCYYQSTFWVYIMDRQGRIVWYYADGTSRVSTAYPRVALDGEYIVLDRGRSGGTLGVVKMTLDRQYYQMIALPNLGDAIDVTTDGSVLYDAQNELREYTRTGTIRTVWSCRTYFGSGFQCYTNTIEWDPATDTVLMSYPDQGTVIQVHRGMGTVVGQYGKRAGSYAFSPSSWTFEFQHGPSLTPQGTLLISSHMPGYSATMTPVAGQHAFMEFTIDHTAKRLTEKWYYNEGQEWAMYKGMAARLPNGNTLANYGTGGVIREITPDKRTAFHVKFDVATGNDFFNKMVGNNVLVNDLYALNGGGPK